MLCDKPKLSGMSCHYFLDPQVLWVWNLKGHSGLACLLCDVWGLCWADSKAGVAWHLRAHLLTSSAIWCWLSAGTSVGAISWNSGLSKWLLVLPHNEVAGFQEKAFLREAEYEASSFRSHTLSLLLWSQTCSDSGGGNIEPQLSIGGLSKSHKSMWEILLLSSLKNTVCYKV